MKQAVMIIAKKVFRDEELLETREELEKAGVKTIIASSSEGDCIGKLGAEVKAEISLSDIKVKDYDAVVFVGGNGAEQYYEDNTALTIAKDAAAEGKTLAAICIAPRILANAGLLEGIQATCYESEAENIEKLGAEFIDTDVVVDGRIITGSGPHASRRFGQAIAKSVKA
jgi:protease I